MGRDAVRPRDATAPAKSYEDRLQRGKREAAERERERLADVDERFADFWKALGFAGGGSDGKTLAGAQLADGSWNIPAAGWPFGDSAYILYDSDTGAATLVRR